MFKLSVGSNVDQILREMATIANDQVPFATALALTRTAKLAEEAEVKEIKDVFDRPTPFAQNSVYTKTATKRDLVAYVAIKSDAGKGTPAEKFLSAEIKGGSRVAKRFEVALQAVGAMPPGYRAMPGSAAKLDGYGNMSRGQIVQILSYFKAFPEQGHHANITDKRRTKLARGTKSKVGFEFFAVKPGETGHLLPGIYQRFKFGHGSSIKPIIIFVDGALYHAIFDFGYVAASTTAKQFPQQLRIAFADAIRTRRTA